MPPLPEAIIPVVDAFASLVSCSAWAHAQVLLVGTLRVLKLGQARCFEKYHRVLSRARWPKVEYQ